MKSRLKNDSILKSAVQLVAVTTFFGLLIFLFERHPKNEKFELFIQNPTEISAKASKFIDVKKATYVCMVGSFGTPFGYAESEYLKSAQKIIHSLKLKPGRSETDWQIISFNEYSLIDSLIVSGEVLHVFLNASDGDRKNYDQCVDAGKAHFHKFGKLNLIGLVSK